jgi:hypothetical protein
MFKSLKNVKSEPMTTNSIIFNKSSFIKRFLHAEIVQKFDFSRFLFNAGFKKSEKKGIF